MDSIKGKENNEPQDKQVESPIIEHTHNLGGDQYITRSIELSVKFPPENVDDRQEDIKKEEASPPDNKKELVAADQTSALHNNTAEKQEDELLFYGVVKDDSGSVVDNAAVMVFACYNDGAEEPLGYTLTDSKGAYIVRIPIRIDYSRLAEFKVRAGKASLLPEKNRYYEEYKEKPKSQPSQKAFQDFLELAYYNPGRTIHDLMKMFYHRSNS